MKGELPRKAQRSPTNRLCNRCNTLVTKWQIKDWLIENGWHFYFGRHNSENRELVNLMLCQHKYVLCVTLVQIQEITNLFYVNELHFTLYKMYLCQNSNWRFRKSAKTYSINMSYFATLFQFSFAAKQAGFRSLHFRSAKVNFFINIVMFLETGSY